MNKKDKTRKKSKAQDKAINVAQSFVPASSKKFDPQGSYTGSGIIPAENPVQDADDL